VKTLLIILWIIALDMQNIFIKYSRYEG